MSKAASCPTCGKALTTAHEAKWRPFCSERCKMGDLGAWFSDRYRIAADDKNPDQRDESADKQ